MLVNTDRKNTAFENLLGLSRIFTFKDLAKLCLKPTNNDSVFLDFRVYRAFVNTEIKEHGDDLKVCSVCKEFSSSKIQALGKQQRILS